MKPQPDAADAVHGLSRHDQRARRVSSFPRLECELQPRRFGNSFDGSDSPRRRPSLSHLTREVLWADASRSFRLETAVLGFVALVCAWPIAVMIHEVYRLLK
ncbi:MAG: hypothetical protein M3429_05080 [Verrucomicrobiota bacterium]|nr:hypothetical protein [Verrucomicrobiota bacterium]